MILIKHLIIVKAMLKVNFKINQIPKSKCFQNNKSFQSETSNEENVKVNKRLIVLSLNWKEI